ncbi:MAG: hypothetical protein J3K34DRAFT_523053 [Monoraphidium minutum]|nr:MAG: hypothetical protein J3K34DRAFT_523053 [Monoraphidium minutum]
MEAQQAAGAPPPGVAADGRRAPGAPALQGGQPPGLFYGEKALLLDNMTGADVRMMKVKDLREVLRTLGLSEEGGRYECRDRLLTVLAAHQAVKQGNRPALMAERRGHKGELEKRLSSAALVAAGHEEAALTEADSATAAAAAAIAAAAKQGADVLLDQYNEAAATVLLLAGGAGAACGAGVGAAAAPAAQLSLEAARVLADALQTAPLLGPSAWGGLGAAAEQGGPEPARGVAVQAEDLAAQLPSVAVGGRVEAADLAKLAKATATPALSALPPAAPGAAALAAAFAAEGAPLAGGGGDAGAGPPPPRRAPQGAAAADGGAGSSDEEGGVPEAGGGGPASEPSVIGIAQKLAAWAAESELDADYQTFALSAADDAGGAALVHACGVERAAVAAKAMLESGAIPGVVLEPYHAQLMRWQVLVLGAAEAGDPPAALMPAEVEMYHSQAELMGQQLELAEHDMLQVGLPPEEIAHRLKLLAAAEPDPAFASPPPLPRPLAGLTVKLHSPPRLSRKARGAGRGIIHTIRHAAAKAVSELGLNVPGAALLVTGWADADPQWRARYERGDAFLEPAYEDDTNALLKLEAQEAAAEAADPLPLSGYYDPVTGAPDLAKFDPALRCARAANGEATVFVAGVAAGAALVRGGAALQQAAEVGISPAALARHLVNAAALAAGAEVPHLPVPPPPVDMAQSFALSHFSGANRPVQDLQAELDEFQQKTGLLPSDLHDTCPWTRVEEGLDDLPAPLDLDQPFAELVALQQSAICPPYEATNTALVGREPEDWTPEFDGRTQEEITAEREAALGFTEEQAAARAVLLANFWDKGLSGPRELMDQVWGPSTLPGGRVRREERSEEELRERDRPTGLLADALGLSRPDEPKPDPWAAWGPGVAWDDATAAAAAAAPGSPQWARAALAGGVGATADALARAPEGALAAPRAGASGGREDDPADIALPEGATGASLLRGVIDFTGSYVPASWAAAREDLPPSPIGMEGGAALEAAVEAALRRRPRVWVLMGGDGDERHLSLASGANVVAKLRHYPDIQVEAFLLPPSDAGAGEAARRKALLARATEYTVLGIPEGDWPDSMSPPQLRHMLPLDLPLPQRLVWALQEPQLQRPGVESALVAAEAAAARSGVRYWGQGPEARDARVVQGEVQRELDYLMVQGVGTAWGLPPGAPPLPPRAVSVEDWAAEAAGCGAVVFLALHDAAQVGGALQGLLEAEGVPFTGAPSAVAETTADKLRLTEWIEAYAAARLDQLLAEGAPPGTAAGVAVPPKKLLATEHLADATEWAADAAELWQQLMEGWEGGATALAIKPVCGGGGIGVAKITGPADLAVYGAAIHEGAAIIPGGLLASHPTALPMPPRPGPELIVEPWVEADEVTLTPGVGGGGGGLGGGVGAARAGRSPWVEVTAGLVGDVGTIKMMAPTLVVPRSDGGRHHVTPPPPGVLGEGVVESMADKLVEMADQLGLRGLVQVDGFVNAETGELIVLDIKAHPKLTDGHPLLQQALLEEPPLLPHALFRGLLSLGVKASEDDRAAAAAARLGTSAWYAAGPAAPLTSAGAGGGADEYDLDLGPDEEGGLDEDLASDLGATWTR